MKKFKEFFQKLIYNKVLVLPLVIGIVFLVVAILVIPKNSNKEPNINENLPSNIENVIAYSDTSDKLIYEVYGAGYMIKGIKSGASLRTEYMILPDTFNGKKILKIKEDAFRNNSEIKGVIIPASIVTIGDSAFRNCKELRVVTFSSNEELLSGTTIGANAFAGCEKLGELTLGSSVASVSENAFYNTDISTLFVGSRAIYLQIVNRNSLEGALKNAPTILTFGQTATNENIDDGSNDYLNNFYYLSSRIISGKTYAEYNLKGEILFISLNGNGANDLARDEIEFIKEAQEDGSTRIIVLDDDGNLVVDDEGKSPESVQLPRVHKLGYWFNGWSMSNDENVKVSTIDASINSDISLTAGYFSRLIYVEYDLNGGVNHEGNQNGGGKDETIFIASGSPKQLYSPTKEHSMFNGWYLDADFKTPISKIDINIFNHIIYEDEDSTEFDSNAKSITLYAKFDTILLFDSTGKVTGINPAVGLVTDLLIPTVVNEIALTSIGDGAFKNATRLKTVTIGSGITKIGANAFENCYNLESVEYNGAKITDFGGFAFLNCTKLKDFKLGESIISLGEGLFKNCTNLKSVEFSENSYFVQDSKLSAQMFSGCKNLITINIPVSTTDIGESCFKDCEKLVLNLNLFTKLSSIGAYAFSGSAIESVTLKSQYTAIGEGAFANCYKLASVTIAEDFGIKIIPNKLFSGCRKLTSVIFNSLTNEIGEEAFCGCSGLKTLVLGQNVVKISKNAFSGTSIEELIIPKSVSQILEGAFKNSKLVNVNLSNLDGWWSGDTFVEMENAYSFAKKLNEGIELSHFETFVMSNEDENVVVGLTEKGKRQTAIIIPSEVKVIKKSAFNEACVQKLTFELESGWFKTDDYEDFTILNIDNITGNPGIVETLNSYDLSRKEVFVFDENGKILTGLTEVANQIKKLIVPEGVETIEAGAIDGLTHVEKIVLPKSLIKIKEGAFKNLGTSLKIEFLDSTYWSSNETAVDFENESENCTKLLTLKECTKLSVFKIVGSTILGLTEVGKTVGTITIPKYIQCIGEEAFVGCDATYVYISASVKEIGANAFKGLQKVEQIIFLDASQLEMVGDGAFEDLAKLTKIEFSADDVVFGVGVFKNCTELKRVVLPTGTKKITEYMFANCLKLNDLSGISNVVEIEMGAFMYSGLTEIRLSENLRYIRENAFRECRSLTTVTFSEGLISVGDEAFRGCENLSGSLSLPNSLEVIGWYSFSGCKKLDEIKFSDDANIKTIGKGAFYGSEIRSLYLPTGARFKIKSTSGTEYGVIEIGSGDITNGPRLAYYINERYYSFVLTRAN